MQSFKEKNTGRDDHTIDLHGLHVDEAVNRARQAIQQAKREVQPAPRPPACAELLYMLPHDGVDSPFMELIFDWSSRRRQMAVIKCLSLRCMAMCPDCHRTLVYRSHASVKIAPCVSMHEHNSKHLKQPQARMSLKSGMAAGQGLPSDHCG